MKAKKENIKKPRPAKKLILTFLIIGIILGLVLCGLFIASEMRYFEENYANHTHDYSCYREGYLVCHESWSVETYGTALKYALQYSPILYVLYFGGPVGGCILIAGVILLIKIIVKKLKPIKVIEKKLKPKQFERTTEDIDFFSLTRSTIAEEKVLIKGVFGGMFIVMLLYMLAVISFVVFTIIDITGWWDGMMIAIGLGAAIALVIFGLILSNILKNRQLIVTNKRVIARGAFGFRTDIPMEKVTDASMRWCGGVGCGSPSLKVMFHFCKNKTEVFDAIIAESVQRDNKV